MPLEVSLSLIGNQKEAFEKAVNEHIAHLHAFNGMVGKPRPTAHPLVESAILKHTAKNKPDTYTANYVFIDDLPPEEEKPKPTLDQRKVSLHHAVVAAENAAKYKILPMRKVRLATVKMQLAMGTKEDDRTPEQLEDIASYNHVQKIWHKYDLIAAQAESDLDDLTEDTIDSWNLPIFE